MKKYILSNGEYNGRKLDLGFINTESEIISIDFDKKMMIFKKFIYEDTINNKVYTLNHLDKNSNCFDERFIMPEYLAHYKDKVVGFIMNYVDGINFGTYLDDVGFPHQEKVKHLYEIGVLLEDLKKIRKNPKLANFYIGDLQERNFILNKKTGKLNICDLDSCSIGNNSHSYSKYLCCSYGVDKFKNKYPKVDDKYIPNINSDIYCYVILILNYLYYGYVEDMNISEYNQFLNYLDSLKSFGKRLYSKEFLDVISKIYSNDDNINPYMLLDSISEKALRKTRKFQICK